MFSNSNMNNIHHNNGQSSHTSWHPIQTSSSYDLWELPQPTRALAFDEDDPSESEPRSTTPQSQSMMLDFENQFIAPLLSSWSFSSPRNQDSHYPSRPRLGSSSSVNSTRTTQSHGERSSAKKSALGDATNTAPILRIPRSRFL